MASLETTRGLDARTISRIKRNPQQALNIINNVSVPGKITYRPQESYTPQTAPQARQVNVPTDMYNTAPDTRRRRTTNGNYTIQKGDTLSAIAQRYGTTVQAIAEANGIADVNKIYVGDSLNIPGNNTTKTNTSTQSNRVSSTKTQQTITNSTVRQNNETYASPTGKTLPSVKITDTNNSIYRPNTNIPEVQISGQRMSNDDIIAARYQRQINNQRARDKYYRNQRMAQGRRAEQRAANRPNYEGLRNFTIAAAAAPGAYLFGTAAAPYVMQGAQTVSNGRNWIEAGNRVTEGAKRIGTRIEQNAIARNNVRGIKEANRAAQQLERPINNRRTMREVRKIQRGLRSPQYPGYEPTPQPSLATAKPKPASKLKSRIYQRTHTKQAYDNPNIQPYGQYNSPVGPQPKPKVKRASRSKQGSKKQK